MNNKVAIVGIHTGIGKTVASAVLCEALAYDYWKPVQAGDLHNSDSLRVADLVSNQSITIHPERYRLNSFMSPHVAARIDQVNIQLSDFQIPVFRNGLVIETAGGLFSPLNDTETMLDLIKYFHVPVVLVSKNYLGSINHTLLTIEVLKKHKVEIIGLLFNGEHNVESEEFITVNSKVRRLGSIPEAKYPDKTFIKSASEIITSTLEIAI